MELLTSKALQDKQVSVSIELRLYLNQFYNYREVAESYQMIANAPDLKHLARQCHKYNNNLSMAFDISLDHTEDLREALSPTPRSNSRNANSNSNGHGGPGPVHRRAKESNQGTKLQPLVTVHKEPGPRQLTSSPMRHTPGAFVTSKDARKVVCGGGRSTSNVGGLPNGTLAKARRGSTLSTLSPLPFLVRYLTFLPVLLLFMR